MDNMLTPQSARANHRAFILLVEDEVHAGSTIRQALELAGYEVFWAQRVDEAQREILARVPELVILDLLLDGPGTRGIDVARFIHSRHAALPIIIFSNLTGRDRAVSAALEAGASTYVSKTYGLQHLLAEVRLALITPRPDTTEGAPQDPGHLRVGKIEIDSAYPRLWIGAEEKPISTLQWAALSYLARQQGHIVTHETLIEHIWGDRVKTLSDPKGSLRQLMAELRRLIDDDPYDPCYLTSDIGIGYRLRAPD